MPSMYTHQQFGNEVEALLPKELRENRIAPFRDLFSIGFQGPDIYFFYRPLSWGEVPQYGNRMHDLSGREFFGRALEQYYSLPSGTDENQRLRQAVRSYLYGVLCHYALDSTCHKYIDEVDASGVTSHAELEGDYDRRLIARAGRNPVEEDVACEFHPSAEAARAIAVLYPEMTADITEEALRSCVRLQHLLRCPGDRKRNFFYSVLRLIGKYDSFHPHIMNKNPDAACQEAEDHLDELYQEALPLAVRLITELDQCMEETDGRAARQLCRSFVEKPEYHRNFGGIEVQ